MSERRPDSANPSIDGEKEPARGQSIAGPTYENPNDDERYEPPEEDLAHDDGDEDYRR